MVHLSTLARTDLRLDSGVAVDAILRRPRVFALLVYLAVEGRQAFVRRDRINSVFWPESPDASARRSLSQALHVVRGHLGGEAIELRGKEEVRLAPTVVRSDICDFLNAADAEDPEAALRQAVGEFLPGFYAGGLREFDEWVDTVRRAMARAVAEAGWKAAERAIARSEIVAAGTYARRACAACQDDEPATRRLMELLGRIGDRAGAVEAYAALSSRLEREYELEPADSTRMLAEQLRESGDLCRVELPQQPDPADVGAQAAPALTEPPAADQGSAGQSVLLNPRGHGLVRIGSFLVTASLLAAFLTTWGHARRSAARVMAERAVVTLYSESPSPLSSGLRAGLARHLSGSAELIVRIPDSVPVPRERGELAHFSVRTAVLRSDSLLSASVMVLDRDNRLVIGSFTLSEPRGLGDSLDKLSGRIAVLVRQAVGAALENRKIDLAGLPSASRRHWEGIDRQIAEAESLSYRGVRDVARIRFISADSELARLERITPGLALLPWKRSELAFNLMGAWLLPPAPDPVRARAALVQGIGHASRALSLEPDDARALESRGVLRYWLWLTTPPDSDRLDRSRQLAERDLRRATRLSPNAARAWALLSTLAFYSGEFPEAYLAARNALAADVFQEHARTVRPLLFSAALEVGDASAASDACEMIAHDDAHSWVAPYCKLVLLALGPPNGVEPIDKARALRESALADRDAATGRDAVDAAYGVVLARGGKANDARAIAVAITANAEHNPEALPHAAWLYTTLGDAGTARELLRRFVAVQPSMNAWVYRSRRFVVTP